MAINEQKDLFDMVVNFDNSALYKLVKRAKEEVIPTYLDLNYALACFFSGYSSGYRFAGHVCCTSWTVQTNLIPFPTMNQVMPGCELYLCSEVPPTHVRDSMHLLFDERNFMLSVNPTAEDATVLTNIMMYSGEKSVYFLLRSLHETSIPAGNPKFIDYIPCHTKLLANFHGLRQPVESPFYPGSRNNLCTLMNGSAINQVFKPLFGQYNTMKKKKSIFLLVYRFWTC